MGTAVICGIIIILCYIGIKSTMKRVKSGCCSGGSEKIKSVKVTDKNENNYKYKYDIEVDGLVCDNCRKRLENAFNTNEGMYAKVDLQKKVARLNAKQSISEEQIKDIVASSGYFIKSIHTA